MSQDEGVHPVRMGFCPQKTVKMLIRASSHLISPTKAPSEASIMEIFMCGTICGYGRVMQAQEQGGLAEPEMKTNHPSAWRVWSP